MIYVKYEREWYQLSSAGDIYLCDTPPDILRGVREDNTVFEHSEGDTTATPRTGQLADCVWAVSGKVVRLEAALKAERKRRQLAERAAQEALYDAIQNKPAEDMSGFTPGFVIGGTIMGIIGIVIGVRIGSG